jgi:L-aminopeptidase/D-esterase-like protein
MNKLYNEALPSGCEEHADGTGANIGAGTGTITGALIGVVGGALNGVDVGGPNGDFVGCLKGDIVRVGSGSIVGAYKQKQVSKTEVKFVDSELESLLEDWQVPQFEKSPETT